MTIGSDASGKIYLTEDYRTAISKGPAFSTANTTVVFHVLPEISESRSTLYSELNELRQPGGIIIFMGATPRTFSINARFVSRTSEEATLNYKQVNLLKGWSVPNKLIDAQEASKVTFSGKNTPSILRLHGHKSSFDSVNQLFKGIPVVMTSLNITYPSDVSYIPSLEPNISIPVIQNITIELKEARSLDELTKGFKMADYKTGNLKGW